MRLTLSSKLSLVLILILLIALIPVAWSGIRFFRQDKETSLQDLNAQTVSTQARDIARRLTETKRWLGLLAATAEDRNLQNVFSAQFRDHVWAGVFRLSQGRMVPHRTVSSGTVAGASFQIVFSDTALLKQLVQMTEGDLALFRPSASKEGSAVLMATRLRRDLFGLALAPANAIYPMTGTRPVYAALLLDQDGNLLMHTDQKIAAAGESYAFHPLVPLLKNPRTGIGGQTSTYEDPVSKNEMLGAYAPLGVASAGLILQMPKRQAFAAAGDLIRRFGFIVLVIFSITVLFGMAFASTLTRPIRKLADLTKKVGQGDFNVKLERPSNDEIGDLTLAFNRMGGALIERDQKLEQARQQLVQSEKMSAFGQMSAGIAHEVKNPLAGVLGYAQLAKRKASEESGMMKYLEIIEKETKRCKDIVENLMRFARQEKVNFEDVDVAQVVADAVALVDHQVTISGIKIERKDPPEGGLPPAWGNGNQIQQVLMNLMLNAQQAMKDKGTLTVSTQKADKEGWAQIQISDTGEGIAPENLKKIFEPFFTTKSAGRGTGLGLAVTYGIIKDHKGEIDVQSELGQGTTFTIQLPSKQVVQP